MKNNVFKKFEQFQDHKARIYPELHKNSDGKRVLSRTITFQVTDDCNLECTYCYQINKGKRKMSFEVAKKFIDWLLSRDETCEYINPIISPFLVIEFIGGEPFLEIELIDQIMDYLIEQMFQLQHPWATRYMISICSNGTLYFKPEVQKFIAKHQSHFSFSVTIDGNKELHDKCRIFPDGSGSYDLATAAAQDWINRGGYMGSKVTICPENLDYLNEALRFFTEQGYEEINANCVYEDGWTISDAKKLYNQMKLYSDYILDNNLDIYCSLYEENYFKPKSPDDNQNWCGGTGSMLSCDPDGWMYPCIRYMESSLGDDQEAIRIGHVDYGIEKTQKEKNWVTCLNNIDRKTQSTEECYYCPIAEGCSWCSAYNYQVFGTPDKRATYICEPHKARSLANIYYWNKKYQKYGYNKNKYMWCPKEWAIPIIGEKEYNYLLTLSNSKPISINDKDNYNYENSLKIELNNGE